MLAGLKEVLANGKKRGIAIGSFNTPNLECLSAVLDAAEELDVPVIIAHAQCHENVAPLDKIGPVMVELAKRSKVKVCVHLDHGEDEEYCKRAIELGFTSVMIDYSTLSYEENVKGTKMVTDYAHAHGVDVEAELGALPQREGGERNAGDPSDLYTKPELVPDFIEKTGIDALAIAFGTAHGIYKTKPILNMDIISKRGQWIGDVSVQAPQVLYLLDKNALKLLKKAIFDFIDLRKGDRLVGNVPGDNFIELPAQSLNAISELGMISRMKTLRCGKILIGSVPKTMRGQARLRPYFSAISAV